MILKKNTKTYKQKAAMFGLDARIALMIFISLSIVAGASLHAVFLKIKYVTATTKIKEAAKAVESYMLDVNENIPIYLMGRYADTKRLINYNHKNWKGPYLQYSLRTVSGVEFLDETEGTPPYFSWLLFRQKEEGLGGHSGIALAGSDCDSNSVCYYWLRSHFGRINSSGVLEIMPKADDFAKQLDIMIDGEFNAAEGDLRIEWYQPNNPIIYYKVMKIL